MNKINFVRSLSPSEQKQIIRWAIVSLSLFIVLVIAMPMVNVYQWYRLRVLRETYDTMTRATRNYDAAIARHVGLKAHCDRLAGYAERIKQCAEEFNCPIRCLAWFKEYAVDGVSLVKLTVQQRSLSLVIQSALSPRAGIAFVDCLMADAGIETLKMVSMQPYTTGTLITLRGTIVPVH